MTDDLISRQAAIDALERSKDKTAKGDIGGFYNKIIQNNIEKVEALPSAQPERKRGKWKPFDRAWGRSIYHCTACGEAEDCPTEMGKVIWRFCPNCGAEMEEMDD